MSPHARRELSLPGGRTLCFQESGSADGDPVFVLHGTPGCRLNGVHPHPGRVAEAGLRLITYDRPGYGGSSRHAGRSVVDAAGDVIAIADALGIGRFAVTGGSGGAPHALAVAAVHPDRVLRAASVVGVAPMDAPGLDWIDGMDPANVEEARLAREDLEGLRAWVEHYSGLALENPEDPMAMLGEFELSDADRAVLADPVLLEAWGRGTRETFAGPWGWIDDDLAFAKPWGFDPASITVPAEVRYGETDVLVPAGHGRWLAERIPNAEVFVDTDAGHLSTPDESLASLREFVDRAGGRT